MKKDYKKPTLEEHTILVGEIMNNTSELNIGGTTEVFDTKKQNYKDENSFMSIDFNTSIFKNSDCK